MISKETENKIIELCNSGMCIRHIAKELNLSDSPVERVLKENGLKAVIGNKTVVSEEEERQIADAYVQGMKARDIMSRFSIPESLLYKILKAYGITPKKQKNKEYAPKIIEMYNSGVGRYTIAKEFGVSVGVVAKIIEEAGISRGVYRIDEEAEAKAIEMFNQGYGRRVIERELGISSSRLYRIYKDYDLHRTPSHLLTEAEIQGRLGEEWEYVSGYTGYYSKVIVRCKLCGKQKEVSRRSVLYNGLGECECKRIERKAAQETEKETEKILAFWDELQKPRPLKKDIKIEFCKICGKPFIKEGRSPYCSEKCSRRARRLKEGRATDKRLRRMKSGEMDDITLDDLIVRDSNICWICGKPCDQTDFDYNGNTFIIGRMYPTVDHVVPLAKGGTHTWDNVRLAHMICNSLKRDKLPPGCLTRADSRP